MAGSEPDEGLDPAEVVPTDNSTGAPVELPIDLDRVADDETAGAGDERRE